MNRAAAISQPMPDNVAQVYDGYPDQVRSELLKLRTLVLDTAATTDGVGAIEETLRWGVPSYLTTESGSGSTIRLSPTAHEPTGDYALYFICRTKLVDEFEEMFGSTFSYDRSRALVFSVGDSHPKAELRTCIARALTYHLAK